MIRAISQTTNYQTQITNGANVSVADTTSDKGGSNAGFRPHELLEAALASCMNMSLRMAAERLEIPLAGVTVAISLNRKHADGATFECHVEFQDEMCEAHKAKLLTAIERCPVRATLSQPLNFSLALP